MVSVNKVWWEGAGRGIQGIKPEGLYQPPPLKPASSGLNTHAAVTSFPISGKFLHCLLPQFPHLSFGVKVGSLSLEAGRVAITCKAFSTVPGVECTLLVIALLILACF